MKKSAKIIHVIAKNIRHERSKQKISQEKLAEFADCHRTYIGMVERAEINITITNLEKIAIALKIDIRELLNC